MNNCKQTFASNNKMYTFLYSFYVWALRQVFTSFVKTLMYELYFDLRFIFFLFSYLINIRLMLRNIYYNNKYKKLFWIKIININKQ